VVRVGFGSDSHKFDRTRSKPLILGGVKLDETHGLEANSDGDVILHALFNALSQACGGESLGYYADPLFKKGITDSIEYLKIAMNMVSDLGYRIQNVGIMVEALKPRLAHSNIMKIKKSIARLTGVSEKDVGIIFTSGEGLTAFGRGEGILAQAIVSLVKG